MSSDQRRPSRRPNSLAREAEFRARVQELGGEVLEAEWLGERNRHRVRCSQGHEYAPVPKHVRQGGSICRICSGTHPGMAEAAFRARVEELGGTVLEPKWLGSNRPHRVLCAVGHEGSPRPSDVRQGDGICRTCAVRDPRVAEAAFRARLAELGAVLLEPSYLGANMPHRVQCDAGHSCTPRPSSVRKGSGVCRTCAGRDPRAAEAAFRKRLAEVGATLLEPTWLGVDAPHRVRCAAGHDCTPRPANAVRGTGVCRTCAGKDPKTAEAAFRARLSELGATLLEPTWLGTNAPHRVRCTAGHSCSPRPGHVQQGRGICRTCAGKDPQRAEAEFRARLAELGATLLEPVWLGSVTPHRVRCAAGHDCAPRPGNVRRGEGVCRTCAGKDSEQTEAAFRARLAELGATLLEPTWLGANTPHQVRCGAGHDCTPRPGNVRDGGGICRTCSGMDPRLAEAAFRARLTAMGATLLEPTWLGANTPHRVRCVAGHDCTPRPASLRDGAGICSACAGREWDVLYVVANDLEVVKFGITSGDPRPRLRVHRRDGLDQVVRLVTGLPDGIARALENNIKAALRDAREEPIRGREYFPARTLPLILDLIDHHPAIRALGPAAAGAG